MPSVTSSHQTRGGKGQICPASQRERALPTPDSAQGYGGKRLSSEMCGDALLTAEASHLWYHVAREQKTNVRAHPPIPQWAHRGSPGQGPTQSTCSP